MSIRKKNDLRRVGAFRVSRQKVPILVPFKITGEALPTADPVFIQIEDQSGTCGLGEASAFPILTGDDPASAELAAQEICESLLNLTTDEALQRLDAEREACLSSTAWVGVESALLDLKARQTGITLGAIFGPTKRSSFTTDITLPALDASDVEDFWKKVESKRFPVVKVKVTGNVGEDCDRIRSLLKVAPPHVQISLDGNQGYSKDSAQRLLRELASLVTPLCFEQPLPMDDLRGSAELARSCPVPICLDESVKTVQDVEKIAREKIAPAINLKIMKSGVRETWNMMVKGERLGIRMMIGGMLESEVAMGVSLQLLGSGPAVEWIDLDTPFFFLERPTPESPWHKDCAELTLPSGPGHGLQLV